MRATQKFGEHEQASTRLNFASKSTKGKILRAVKNFNGPFVTPSKLDVSAPEPAIQLCDTGQRIPCFNTCQLTKIQVAGYHTSLKSKCVISHCFLWYGRTDSRADVRLRVFQIFLAMGLRYDFFYPIFYDFNFPPSPLKIQPKCLLHWSSIIFRYPEVAKVVKQRPYPGALPLTRGGGLPPLGHYPEVGSDMPSVWNFSARSSVVISREHQEWCCEIRSHVRLKCNF